MIKADGWVGRAARCRWWRVLFRTASRRTGRASFPGIRLSGDLCCEGCGLDRAGVDKVVAGRADDEGLCVAGLP